MNKVKKVNNLARAPSFGFKKLPVEKLMNLAEQCFKDKGYGPGDEINLLIFNDEVLKVLYGFIRATLRYNGWFYSLETKSEFDNFRGVFLDSEFIIRKERFAISINHFDIDGNQGLTTDKTLHLLYDFFIEINDKIDYLNNIHFEKLLIKDRPPFEEIENYFLDCFLEWAEHSFEEFRYKNYLQEEMFFDEFMETSQFPVQPIISGGLLTKKWPFGEGYKIYSHDVSGDDFNSLKLKTYFQFPVKMKIIIYEEVFDSDMFFDPDDVKLWIEQYCENIKSYLIIWNKIMGG
ncbi:MAG: hypothetical protein ACOCT9_02135 [archaeon]